MNEDNQNEFIVTDETGKEREHRHRDTGSVWVGITLILIGILFILRVSHIISLGNWWALFILIPAVASLGSAITAFARNGGQYTRSVSGGLGGFLFLTVLAAMFLFGLDWGRYWPVFIVIAGVSVLLNAFARRDRNKNRGSSD